MEIPKSHPRYISLLLRDKISDGLRHGLVAPQGLIAQGRAEAFDYLIGERTIPSALKAEKAAAAYLVLAGHPVLSVNGNVAALASEDMVRLARIVPAKLEINLFYKSESRIRKISDRLQKAGAESVLGAKPNARIPGLDSKRALCSLDGIYNADVVLVPLEDGDRAQALAMMGKIVLAIDLNPLSRTSRAATVTVVDELTRALVNIIEHVHQLRRNREKAERIAKSFNNTSNLKVAIEHINKRLAKLSR